MRITSVMIAFVLLVACSNDKPDLSCNSICAVLQGNCDTLRTNDTIYVTNSVYGIDVKDLKWKRLGRYLFRDSVVKELNAEIKLYNVSGNREFLIGRKLFEYNCSMCHGSPADIFEKSEAIDETVQLIWCDSIPIFYSEEGIEHWRYNLLSSENKRLLTKYINQQSTR